jgi:hypothetical protein
MTTPFSASAGTIVGPDVASAVGSRNHHNINTTQAEFGGLFKRPIMAMAIYFLKKNLTYLFIIVFSSSSMISESSF